MVALVCGGRDKSQRELFWWSVLSRWGKVQVFPDGKALLDFLRKQEPCALVVVDVDGTEGLEDCARVKEIQPAARMLWVTEEEGFLRQSHEIQTDGFLVRPLPEDEPGRTLERLLGTPERG